MFLAGRTVEQARDAVAAALLARRVKGKAPADVADPKAKEEVLSVEDIKHELQVDDRVQSFLSSPGKLLINGDRLVDRNPKCLGHHQRGRIAF